MKDKKILFVIFGKRKLIDAFSNNEKHYPSEKNSIELEIYDELRSQIEYICEDESLSYKKYIILRIHEYDVNILDYILNEVEDIEYLNLKFLVLSDGKTESSKEIENIKDLVTKINKISDNSNQQYISDNNKSQNFDEISELIKSNDVMMNLDSLNYLIDVSKKFSKNKENMDDELKTSIKSSLILLSTKLEINNENLLDNE